MANHLVRSILTLALGGALGAGCVGSPPPARESTAVQSVDQATFDACRQSCFDDYDQCDAPCEQARNDCSNYCTDPANREDVFNGYPLCGLRPNSCCDDVCWHNYGSCTTPCLDAIVACVNACGQ